MKTQLVSYDLKAPGKDYSKLHAYLKEFGWARPLESVWFIRTELTSMQLCTGILSHIDGNDRVMVVEVTQNEVAWKNLPADVVTWINSNI